MLTFDPQAHIYYQDGHRLSGVTELIQWAGLMKGEEWFTEEGRARGTAVHQAIHFMNTGGVDPDSIDPRITPYLRAYEKFVRETGFAPVECIHAGEIRPAVELALASRKGYAGTLDANGLLHDELTLIDYKSGAYERWQDVQLELYWRLLVENASALAIVPPRRRGVVQLKNDGTYKLHTPSKDNEIWTRQTADALERIAEARMRVRLAA